MKAAIAEFRLGTRNPIQGMLLVLAVLALAHFPLPSRAAAQAPDPSLVQQKIQALAVRDDTLRQEEQPRAWLTQRREQVTPQIIAGLDSPNPIIASNCLAILSGLTNRPPVTEALTRIGGQPSHPQNHAALLELCRFPLDARATRLLEQALADAARFPNPEHRARFAEALGRKEQAVELLARCLDTDQFYNFNPIVTRLEKVGHPAAIPHLERKTKDPHWEIAASAYLGLAQLDPKQHALTAAQKELLENARRGFKVGAEFYTERQRKLAALPRAELRPFVLQMLMTDAAADAAGILRLWKDQESLPEIRRLMLAAPHDWQAGPFVAAYLEIDGTERSLAEVLELVKRKDPMWRRDYIAAALVRPEYDARRKVAILRRIQDTLGQANPTLVPGALGWQREDLAAVLLPLMDSETNLIALAAFAECTSRDTNRVYDAVLTRALNMVKAQRAADLQAPTIAEAAVKVLSVCADRQVPGCGPLAAPLMDSSNGLVRIQAARVAAAAGGPRERALLLMESELGNAATEQREAAAQCLLRLPCQNVLERTRREAAALTQLGKPTEDYALRVLTTCAGPKSVEAFSPLLDGEAVPRAVHAAWVLAQHPDAATAHRALRRLGLYSIFHHQMYQQGSGIDFPIAANLYFHQVTSRLNPKAYADGESASVILPPELMAPKSLDAPEQAFLLRAYRHLITVRPFVEFWGWNFPGRDLADRGDASYLPWLRIVASEDPYLRLLHVQGQKVAHFPHRQTAAKAIARLTGAPATYAGLAGETLDSAAVPAQPYDQQNQRIAQYVLGRVAAAKFSGRPQTDREWERSGAFDGVIRRLVQDEFGEALKAVFLAESRRRNLFNPLKDAGFEYWRNAAPE